MIEPFLVIAQTFAICDYHAIIEIRAMQGIDGIFYVIVLIMSVVVHEFSHGYVAYLFGDNTARLSGRLTLNPIKHLDPVGSVILPLALILMGTNFIIGWARPVPYNPNNLSHGNLAKFFVSIAGILSNLLIAIIFALVIRVGPSLLGIPLFSVSGLSPLYMISSIIVFTNLILAIFNLMPIPPLDGSKILFSVIPARYRYVENFMEQWGIFLLVLFIITIWKYIAPLVSIIFHLLTGLSM